MVYIKMTSYPEYYHSNKIDDTVIEIGAIQTRIVTDGVTLANQVFLDNTPYFNTKLYEVDACNAIVTFIGQYNSRDNPHLEFFNQMHILIDSYSGTILTDRYTLFQFMKNLTGSYLNNSPMITNLGYIIYKNVNSLTNIVVSTDVDISAWLVIYPKGLSSVDNQLIKDDVDILDPNSIVYVYTDDNSPLFTQTTKENFTTTQTQTDSSGTIAIVAIIVVIIGAVLLGYAVSNKPVPQKNRR